MPSKGSCSFQILSCRVEIHYEDAALERNFDYLVERAGQSFEVRKTLSYRVSGNSPYAIFEEGDFLSRVGRAADVLHVVYGRVYRRVLERFALSGWVALHAALATINGRRTLILGDKGAGKTTLATRLLFAGHAVEGDEMVLSRDGQAMALPRGFHLKPGIERQVPELVGQVQTLPKAFSGPTEISALDPTDLGFDWMIGVGPVDRVIWITPNHGGETLIDSRPSLATIQRIFQALLSWGGAHKTLVAMATKLGGSSGFELVLGDARSAVRLLEELQ